MILRWTGISILFWEKEKLWERHCEQEFRIQKQITLGQTSERVEAAETIPQRTDSTYEAEACFSGATTNFS